MWCNLSPRSRLYNKFPKIYNALEGVSVDFFNKDDDVLDPYSYLHADEEKLVSENPSQVSKEALWLNIRSVFSQSKTGKTNEKASGRESFVTIYSLQQLRNFSYSIQFLLPWAGFLIPLIKYVCIRFVFIVTCRISLFYNQLK